ncbi:MAG: radical SAM protein [Chlorobi bacterium]|nr:radical SAM protein [Chlorobiota bacterium]
MENSVSREASIFPSIGRSVHLHRQPCGLLARVAPLPGKGFQPEIYELNDTASYLLLLCDGITSYEAILNRISQTVIHDESNPVRVAGALFVDLARKRILEFHDTPAATEYTITGSEKYYSPSHFAIELTSECNLRCSHCYRECEPGKGSRLPTDRLLSIMASLALHGVTSLELTGGEPTMHPDFFEILDLACCSFTNIAVLSNGWLLDEAFVSRMANRVNPPFIQIDLDGSDASTHDRLRGVPGSFNNALRAIGALKKYGLRVRAAMNVHKDNLMQLEATLDLARSAGADWFAVSPLMVVGRGRSMEPLDAEEYAFLSAAADSFSARYPDFFFVSKEIEGRINGSITNCGAGSRAMVLGSNGIVRPCLLLDDRFMKMGDLTQVDYPAFLASSNTELFYSIQSPNVHVCEECEHLTFCLGCFVGPVQMAILSREIGREFTCKWAERYPFFRNAFKFEVEGEKLGERSYERGDED